MLWKKKTIDIINLVTKNYINISRHVYLGPSSIYYGTDIY